MDKNTAKASERRRLKIGSYNIALTAAVIAIVIIVNLLVSKLPTIYTHFAANGMDYYSMSAETKAILSEIDTDITAYVVSEKWEEDERLVELLSRYKSLCKGFTVKLVNPDDDEEFFEKYKNAGLEPNSVVFESEKRTKIVLNSEIYESEFTEAEIKYLEMMGYFNVENPKSFSGEKSITGAIDFVTRDDLPIVYTLSGHSELELDDAAIGHIEDHNTLVSELSLEGADSIPEDCAALLIAVPQSDISDEELEMIEEYRARGGDVILLTAFGTYSDEMTPNLAKLTADAGMKGDKGLVVDYTEGMYYQNAYTLMPEVVASEGGITSLMGDTTGALIIDISHGIVKSDETEIMVTPLVTTSNGAYLVDFDEAGNPTERENESGDPIMMGAYSEQETEAGKSTFVWYSSYSLIDSTIESSLKVDGTRRLFVATLDYITGEGESVSAEGIDLSEKKLDVTEADENGIEENKPSTLVWIVVMTAAIPLLIIAGGFATWLRRRRR